MGKVGYKGILNHQGIHNNPTESAPRIIYRKYGFITKMGEPVILNLMVFGSETYN